jgi:outer membrane protein TolC
MRALKGYQMHLKSLAKGFPFLLCISLFASEGNDFLSKLKQEQLNIDKQSNELESDNLKYDWINPINGFYSYTKSNQYSDDRKTGMFGISLEQPVFKSGGIFYAIRYAGANREFLRLSTKLNEQNLIKSVIAAWYAIKRLDLQIKKQEVLIENATIDIIRKKEQYESGFLDSSYLDNAILNKNSLEKSLIDMETNRYEQLMNFEALSDMQYSEILPPRFSLIDEKKFLENSIAIKQKDAATKQSRYLKNMTISNYLPTVSLTGSYNDSKIDNQGISAKDSYSSVGVKVSMPLFDVNRGRSIELKRLAYLKSKLEFADTKRSETKEYQNIVKQVSFLQKKVNLSKQDFNLYKSLLQSTQDLYEAGEKTIYDVDTLKNSQMSMRYDQMIYEVDIQLTLLDLYAKMYGKI